MATMSDHTSSSGCPFVNKEQSANFLTNGYLTQSKLRHAAGLAPDSQTPIRTRAMFKEATLIRGEGGVDAFYDSTRMKRGGAMPKFIQGPLFGEGAVHTLDGEEHSVRKNQLADVAYVDENVADFGTVVDEELHTLLDEWAAGDHADVHTGAALAYGRAAFRWAGVELPRDEADEKSLQMTQLLDGFGHLGPGHIQARLNRRRLDAWYENLITEARSGTRTATSGTALDAMANLRGVDGELIDAKTAGIELQNLTRPTIAVARFAAFAAVALVENPEWVQRIRAEQSGSSFLGGREAVAFAQEVRRIFPFVPMLPAMATEDTEIMGCPVNKDERVALDFYGTLTDPNHWENPETFDPQRFLDMEGLETLEDYEKIKAFIPQGGAEVRTGHRCPGEKIAVTALAATVVALCRDNVSISGSPEDRTFDWTQVLTRPDTGVRVRVTRR